MINHLDYLHGVEGWLEFVLFCTALTPWHSTSSMGAPMVLHATNQIAQRLSPTPLTAHSTNAVQITAEWVGLGSLENSADKSFPHIDPHPVLLKPHGHPSHLLGIGHWIYHSTWTQDRNSANLSCIWFYKLLGLSFRKVSMRAFLSRFFK